MFKYIQILDNFQIDKLCIYLNYDIDIRYYNKDSILRELKLELYSVYSHYKSKKNSIIVMADFSKVNNKNTNNIDIILFRKLGNMLKGCFPEMLYKLIIYDYSRAQIYLTKLIINFVDEDTRKKIILNRKYKPFIELLISNDIDINEKGINILNDYSYSFKDNITVSNNL